MKEYRKEELRSYVIGNIIFIITLSGIFDSVLSKSIADLMDVIHLIFESALLSSILYIYIYIIDSLVPPSLKDKISFFPRLGSENKDMMNILNTIPKEKIKERYIKVNGI